MNLYDPPFGRAAGSKLYCDLTQSWSDVGGGVRTYLLHKRRHILAATPHSHLMIVPGANDEVVEEERAITVTIASPRVPGSPHYRLMLRNGAVRAALERFRPDLIECQDAYNLPWAAIGHRKRHPETALVAAYMTDFPTVYVERPFSKAFGRLVGGTCGRICYSYCGALYRRFDAMFTLSENGVVQGEIRVPHAIINGQVHGDIHAGERLELAPEARISGDVHYRTLEMAAGAQVNGRMSHQSTEAPRELPAPTLAGAEALPA